MGYLQETRLLLFAFILGYIFAPGHGDSCEFAGILSKNIIQTVASRAFGFDVEVTNLTINGYSSERVGFMNDHGSLQIMGRSKATNGKVELKRFFIKTPYLKNPHAHEFTKEYFMREMNVYLYLLPEMQRQAKCPTFASKLFYANPDMIILEDNRAHGFQSKKHKFDSEELKTAAKAIARLHASSLITSEKLGNPLNQIYSESFNENTLLRFEKSNMPNVLLDLILNVTQDTDISRETLRASINKIEKYVSRKTSPNHVASHGDTWSNNLMFDKSNPPNCILVDFAAMHWGDQICDLLQVLYLSAERQTRQLHEREVIETYHKELSKILFENGLPSKIRSFKQLLREYEENRGIGLLYELYYYPMSVDKKTINSYSNGSDALRTFMVRKNNDIIYEFMKRDPRYRKILTNVIEEFVDFSKKLFSKNKKVGNE